MNSTLLIVISCVIAYFIGNISPSTILAKKSGLDIKKEGSGNAGTTNALRVMGKKAGAITFVVDILKGVVAVLLGLLIGGQPGAIGAALCVFVGHIWPVIYKFKGGKGVATTFGAVLGINPIVALLSLLIVAIGVFTSKRMSVGSILGAVAFPLLSIYFEPEFVVVAIIMAAIVIIKHRANIVRLIHGEEPIMSIFEKKDQA